jgi:hypothetical protein
MPSSHPLALPTTIHQEKRAIPGMYVGNKRSKSWFPEYYVGPRAVWLRSASENVQKPNPRPRCESLENANQQPNYHSHPKRRYALVANHFKMLRTRQEQPEIRIPHGWLQNKHTHDRSHTRSCSHRNPKSSPQLLAVQPPLDRLRPNRGISSR